MTKVSVITPIYNSEQYIDRCVQSLLNQTLRDIEIILVDDGSTDSSGKLCDKYASEDSRVRVIHNKNSGMGVSYNTGIKLANGEYIGFLESDDAAQENMFEDLYDLAKKQDLDIAKSAWFNYFSKQDYTQKDGQLLNYNSYDIFDIKRNPNILLVQFSVWSAIYRTAFLHSKNIYYLETPGASYQDVAFSYKAFCSADRISITPNAYVYYTRDNENSSVNSKQKAEVIFNEYKEVDDFFKNNPDVKNYANNAKLIKQYYDYEWNYNRIAEEFKPDFIQRYAEDFRKYKNNGELNGAFYTNIDYKKFMQILENA